jgi:hypothetical protein
MKNQFWAGLGSRALLVKKKFGTNYEQLLKNFGKYFLWGKTSFFKAKNFYVSTKTLCWLLLCSVVAITS